MLGRKCVVQILVGCAISISLTCSVVLAVNDCETRKCKEHDEWMANDKYCWDIETDSTTVLKTASNLYSQVATGGTFTQHATVKYKSRSVTPISKCNKDCDNKKDTPVTSVDDGATYGNYTDFEPAYYCKKGS